jgi:hypothetical protein
MKLTSVMTTEQAAVMVTDCIEIIKIFLNIADTNSVASSLVGCNSSSPNF